MRFDGACILDAPDDALGNGNAGAIDQDAFLPMGFADGSEGGFDAFLVRHVAWCDGAPDTLCMLPPGGFVEIEQADLDALLGQCRCRRGPEAGRTTRHNGCNVASELHIPCPPYAGPMAYVD